jgi:hypothetical protein
MGFPFLNQLHDIADVQEPPSRRFWLWGPLGIPASATVTVTGAALHPVIEINGQSPYDRSAIEPVE